ncbi:hypothetical protein CALCODRAFT_462875 [Calocera cornea HHB12733]|uniref:UBC core domain-containing protein n=1 Tax=Calocera cornea HHB12733 TaxID=1353952 RepID=A0A165JU60_9BASI|nr:hypothetical protein CALCODRAFT_462875 [Calocera cornea HHB12733]
MEREIEQLMEMGATRAQARGALRKSKDVMDAAEKIFSGEYDDVTDADEVASEEVRPPRRVTTPRPHTPEEEEYDEDQSGGEDAATGEEEDEEMDYYDDDEEFLDPDMKRTGEEIDPYAGIFFSKDRREEVIEVEETPERVELHYTPTTSHTLPLMTQGEWMKGCPEGNEQGLLFGLWNDLQAPYVDCPNQCGTKLPRQKGMFTAIWDDFGQYVSFLRAHVQKQCPSCETQVCLACGELVNATRADKPKRKDGNPLDPLFHCSELQGLLLGMGLSMVEKTFEEQVREAKEEKPEDQGEVEGKSRKKRRMLAGASAVAQVIANVESSNASTDEEGEEEYLFGVAKGGRGKGKRAPTGTGYGGGKEDQSGILAALEAQRVRDTKVGMLLSQVRVFLPSLARKPEAETSDYLPHPTALVHVRRRFNSVGSALLRNDSLADMSDRQVIYFELLEWLETVSNHEALGSIMGMPIMMPQSVTLMPERPGSTRIRERKIIYEGSAGPRELLEAIVIQARAALKGWESTKKKPEVKKEMTEAEKRKTGAVSIAAQELGVTGLPPPTLKGKEKEKAEDMRLFVFCNRILATAEAIDKSLSDTKGAAFLQRLRDALPKAPWEPSSWSEDPASAIIRVSETATDQEIRTTYEDWANRIKFQYCDLTVDESTNDSPSFKSVFNSEARGLVGTDLPKRSLAIAKELAVLSTNLPVNWNSSIFLRVDETRVDVIKALIVGPEGTPYENGCYIFDIFLGSNYNMSPPQVKYLTTNDGKFRFNPNLYADGKVCLSLLGTWQGPGWNPGKSTLLQVLISIQSMILCDEPYLNEPGWEAQRGTAASEQYSANVRRMVVHTAMIGNLQNAPEPFADIIRTHFRLKARSLRIQLDKWLALDDGAPIGESQYVSHGKNKTAARSTPPVAEGSKTVMAAHVAALKQMLKELEEKE